MLAMPCFYLTMFTELNSVPKIQSTAVEKENDEKKSIRFVIENNPLFFSFSCINKNIQNGYRASTFLGIPLGCCDMHVFFKHFNLLCL